MGTGLPTSAGTSALSEPYPVPRGFNDMTGPMTLLHVGSEVSKLAGSSVGTDVSTDALAELLPRAEREAMWADTRWWEFRPDDADDSDSLLARHKTPGHLLECLWMVFHAVDAANGPLALPDWLPDLAVKVAGLPLIRICLRVLFSKKSRTCSRLCAGPEARWSLQAYAETDNLLARVISLLDHNKHYLSSPLSAGRHRAGGYWPGDAWGRRRPPAHTASMWSVSSSSTASAAYPTASRPRSWPRPMTWAGTCVSAATAVWTGSRTDSTAWRSAASRVSVEPAIESPSASLATPSRTRTRRVPSMYSPSGEPAAAIASVTNATRPGASRQARATISGSTCTPSLMTSRVTPGQRMAATTGSGARWCMPFMPLKAWVKIVAPAPNAAHAPW